MSQQFGGGGYAVNGIIREGSLQSQGVSRNARGLLNRREGPIDVSKPHLCLLQDARIFRFFCC